ncbi:MAG: hypothetical protein FWE80_01915 [Oscillospiraceae bacterium]|nr:hypothetical protein [Oscillospiraceae bacterium]
MAQQENHGASVPDAADTQGAAAQDTGGLGNNPAANGGPGKPKQKSGGAKGDAGSVYGAEELAASARKQFGVSPEVAAAAMKMAGRNRAAISEAAEIINKFIKREVK